MRDAVLHPVRHARVPLAHHHAHDKAVAEKLAAELGISIPDYAEELFAAKSDVSAFSDAELLRMDSKEYTVAARNSASRCSRPCRRR
jgi:inorganic pyrophosphatase/exopolyphosphatase